MVQVVRSNNFVLNSFVVELNRMLCIVTAEDKQVFDCELLLFTPSHLEASLVQLALSFECLGVKEVKDLFVVDLEEGAGDVDGFGFLGCFSLHKDFVYSS